MPFFCYMLECADGTFYTGWSTNPEQRLKKHNEGKGAKYTKTRRPVKLIYIEELPDKSSALKREIEIKKLSRKKKEELLG
jgi:putative endonuclease